MDKNYTKVCYIQDIAKLLKLNTGKLLSVNEFDILYDCSIQQLHRVLTNTEIAHQVDAMFNPYV